MAEIIGGGRFGGCAGLLEALQGALGCQYISDLHWVDPLELAGAVSELEDGAYGACEWLDAERYLAGEWYLAGASPETDAGVDPAAIKARLLRRLRRKGN